LNARLDQAHQTVVAARARLQDAESDYERVQRILKADPGAIAKAEVDQAEVAVRTARAELKRARRQEDEARTALSYSTLRAPISGRVVDRYADAGDTARQGEPVLRMYDPLSLRLEANVRESIASTLRKDAALTVRVDALEKEFPATVDEIVPSADPGSRSFLVKAALPSERDLYPGMFGRLLIPVGTVERVYVPERAVTEVGQLTFLMVRTDRGPERRYVRLGFRSKEDLVEVISGLAPGEAVLLPKAE
jgi:RND family efflux transporter MFP subunit